MTTNELLVLDTSPYETRVEADVQQVVLRNRDANARFKSPVLKQLKTFVTKTELIFSCKDTFIQEKIELEKKNLPLLTLGSTELGRIVMESKELFKEQHYKYQQQVIIQLKKQHQSNL